MLFIGGIVRLPCIDGNCLKLLIGLLEDNWHQRKCQSLITSLPTASAGWSVRSFPFAPYVQY